MFVEFLVKQTKAANNPVSSLSAVHSVVSELAITPAESPSPRPVPKTSRATAVTHDSVRTTGSEKVTCPLCNGDHLYVTQCDDFKAMNYESSFQLASEQNLCFRCLNPGHRAKHCEKGWLCSLCRSTRHHSLLHDSNKEGAKEHAEPHKATCNNTSVESPCRLFTMIVPVWLSSQERPDEKVLTYALLDAQSNTTFITNKVASKLTASSTQVPLKISTMTSKNCSVSAQKYTGLQIKGFYSGQNISLPPTYSRQHIPYTQSSIPTCDDIEKLPHLKPVAHLIAHKLEQDVGILIGRDCITAMTYLEIIQAPEGCNIACAIRTPIGWCILGPEGNHTVSNNYTATSESDNSAVSHSVFCKSVPYRPIGVGDHNAGNNNRVHPRIGIFVSESTVHLELINRTREISGCDGTGFHIDPGDSGVKRARVAIPDGT